MARNLIQRLFLAAVTALAVGSCQPNFPPEITSAPPTNGREGEPYTYIMKVRDINKGDAESLKAYFNYAPDYLSINWLNREAGEVKISGVLPFVNSNTDFSVSAGVSDPLNAMTSQEWSITVENTSDNDPSIAMFLSSIASSGSVPFGFPFGADGTSRDGTMTKFGMAVDFNRNGTLQAGELYLVSSTAPIVDKKMTILAPGTWEIYAIGEDSLGTFGQSAPSSVTVSPMNPNYNLESVVTFLNPSYKIGEMVSYNAKTRNITSPYFKITSDMGVHNLESHLLRKVGLNIYEVSSSEPITIDLKVVLQEGSAGRGYLELTQTQDGNIIFSSQNASLTYGGISIPIFENAIFSKTLSHPGYVFTTAGDYRYLMIMEHQKGDETQIQTAHAWSGEVPVSSN